MTTNAWTIIANAQSLKPETLALFPMHPNLLVCDGAYAYTQHLAIDVVLGDFDSISITQNSSDPKPLFIESADQNKTDLQKAIEYCDRQQATAITIINALDNQMSHSLHNLSLLKRMNRPERTLNILHSISDNNPRYPSSSMESIIFLHNQSIQLVGPINTSVSLFGFPTCVASSQGLTWDLMDNTLDLSVIDSTRNRLAQSSATIAIQGDALFIFDQSIHLV